jgi:hypothetical protein
MSYCNDIDFETITTKTGQKLCLKKCNKINSTYSTATSDQTICKGMKNGKLITVSRNFSQYRKLNVNGNNSCSTGAPATVSNVLNMSLDKCNKLVGVFKRDMNKVCYVCPSRATADDSAKRKPVPNAQGVLTCY